ncbi:MAG: AAA family ATPase [Bacilli bacterium]|nr:AAA family ATPase [Bacilli bacterium]
MIKRIVLTGGPGSGKTTVKDKIQEHFEEAGYKVIIANETATRVINMGIRSFGTDSIPPLAFQQIILQDQLHTEQLINDVLKYYPNKNIIIIYDRGALDNRAYTNSDNEFNEVLASVDKNLTISNLLTRYDLIINLVSRKDFYTTENNSARSENAEFALELGSKTLKSWYGHENIKIVLPKDTIEEKNNEVINIINSILNEKQIKRQEKYLIDITNLEIASSTPHKEIVQTYLISDQNIEKRLRKSMFNGITTYNLTVYKINDNNEKILVSKEQLTEKIYNKLLEFADNTRQSINKKRYYFSNEDTYYYIDIFDDNNELGILEVNVIENEQLKLPENITILTKVSNDSNYSNKELSLKNNKKLIRKYVK